MRPENSKPEWFHMADADATLPQPKGKPVVRIMASVTLLLLLGAGLVFAQTQESPIAVASPVTSASSTPIQAAQVARSPATQTIAITIKRPAIATMPTGGGGDDGLRSSDDD